MEIRYLAKFFRYYMILRKVTTYWNTISDNHPNTKYASVFSKETYTIAIYKYSIRIWMSEKVSDDEISELRTILEMIFDKKLKGIADLKKESEYEKLLLIKGNANISEIRDYVNYSVKSDEMEECISFIKELDCDKVMKDKIITILETVKPRL